MTRRLEGRVALITGAAHGQGRSHAVRLAQDGADIIAIDACTPVDTAPYPMGTVEELAQTAAEVEALERRIITVKADVRDADALAAATDGAVAELGRLDIVCANAGVLSYADGVDVTEAQWHDVIDINLTGVWHTVKATVPHLRAGGRGGSIILTSSVAGLKPYRNLLHYVAAKHGVVGLMKTLALELAPEMIRVNTVNPTSVSTDMLHNQTTYDLFSGGRPEATLDELMPTFTAVNVLPVPWMESIDISNAVAFLASDEARYITGVALPLDAGQMIK